MLKTDLSLFYMTFPSLEEAEKISRILLEESLIACVNFWPASHSMYVWQGKLQIEREIVGVAKGRAEIKDQLFERFFALHPYEVPAILEIAVQDAPSAFREWIESGFLSLGKSG